MNVELLEKKDLMPILQRMESYENKLNMILDLINRMDDRLLDVNEICERLGISKNAFYQRAVLNEYPFLIKMGNRWKAKESDLNVFLTTINQVKSCQ